MLEHKPRVDLAQGVQMVSLPRAEGAPICGDWYETQPSGSGITRRTGTKDLGFLLAMVRGGTPCSYASYCESGDSGG